MPDIKPGDTVRVVDPTHFMSPYDKKLADRDGVVEWVGPTSAGMWLGYASVNFGKRNGRGKEFSMRIRIERLVLTAAGEPPP